MIAKAIESIIGMIGDFLKGFKGIFKIISVLSKLIGSFLSIVGDVLAVALMPLVGIMRIIGTFFKILIAPYRKTALTAMRQGYTALRAGDMKRALEFFTMGSFTLLMGFYDIIAQTYTYIIQTPIDLFLDLLMFIFSHIPGGAELVGALAALKGGVDSRFDMLRGEIHNILSTLPEKMLNKMLAGDDLISAFTGSVKDLIKENIGVNISFDFNGLGWMTIANSVHNFTGKVIDKANSIISEAKAEAERIKEAARRASESSGTNIVGEILNIGSTLATGSPLYATG